MKYKIQRMKKKNFCLYYKLEFIIRKKLIEK